MLKRLKLSDFDKLNLLASNLKSIKGGGRMTSYFNGGAPNDMIDECTGRTHMADGSTKKDVIQYTDDNEENI